MLDRRHLSTWRADKLAGAQVPERLLPVLPRLVQLLAGDPLTVHHYGEAVPLTVDQPVTRPIPDIETGPRTTQPPGRAPLSRGAHARIGQARPEGAVSMRRSLA